MSTGALEYKASVGAPDVGLLGADDQTGLVEAIVSVTGVRDHDNDIIEPGAYAKTLRTRRPKGIFSHDWGKWVARTEHIEELMPGDSRLPAKTRDGQPWPQGAGGLYVRARFNLATDDGRNGYHNVKFFAETGEAEWSVGYRVPPGKSTKDKAGVRRIKEMDLFEYSPVLFGANSMSSTLAVKSGQPGEYMEPEPDAFVAEADEEWQALQVEADAVKEDDLEEPPAADDTAADDADADAADDAADGDEADEEAEQDDEAGDAEPAPDTPPEQGTEDAETGDGDGGGAADGGEAKGSSASLNRSPKKNWVEKAGQLPPYVREIARSISEKRGVPLERAIPIAIATVKKWARGGDGVTAETRAKAAKAVAEWEKLKARSHAGKAVKTAEEPSQNVVESALYPHLPGTYEELREQIRQQAVKALPEATHVEVMGTWPGSAVITAYGADGKATSYEVPYSVTIGDDSHPETVTLDEPEPVELRVSVDGQEEDGEKMLPFPSQVEDVTAGLKAWLTHAPETKVGRVLSSANERRLLGAVQSLVAVLKSAGMDIDAKPRQGDEQEDQTSDPVVVSDSTAPSVRPDSKRLDPGLVARGYRIAAEASSLRL